MSNHRIDNEMQPFTHQAKVHVPKSDAGEVTKQKTDLEKRGDGLKKQLADPHKDSVEISDTARQLSKSARQIAEAGKAANEQQTTVNIQAPTVAAGTPGASTSSNNGTVNIATPTSDNEETKEVAEKNVDDILNGYVGHSDEVEGYESKVEAKLAEIIDQGEETENAAPSDKSDPTHLSLSDGVKTNPERKWTPRVDVDSENFSIKTDFNVREVKLQHNGVLEQRQAQMAAVDRFMGNSVGTSYKKWVDGGGLDSTAGMSNYEGLVTLKKAFDSEAMTYQPLSIQAENDKKSLEKELKQHLAKNGINLGTKDTLDFKVKSDGSIQVNSAGKGNDTKKIEEILNSNPAIGQKLLKTSAMMKAHMADSDTEMTLVDSYLQDKLGYGLKDIKQGEDGILGFDANLDSLIADDPLLETQIMMFKDRTNSFEADWSFGNDTLANKSHSAESLLPSQAVGMFSGGLLLPGSKASAYEFSVTPDGTTKALNVKGSNLTNSDYKNAMNDLIASLNEGEGTGEIERVRQATKAAIAEHMVNNGGKEEDYQAVVTIKNGKWGIRVENNDGDKR